MLDSPWEELLHYGLLVGAVIQLVALASIIILPSRPDEDDSVDVQDSSEEKVPEQKPPSVTKKNKEKGVRKRKK